MGSFARDTRWFLAIDLGAESGRGMLAGLDGERVALEEVHRFPNEPVRIGGTLCWDAPRLLGEVKAAIAKAGKRCRERGERLDGIGVDAWGVDYGLLGPDGGLLSAPVHYRDPRTDGIVERVLDRVPRRVIFEETGIQFLQLNTLFQLAAENEREPGKLARARRLLFIPDLFHYFLTGRELSEETIASTSQLWNPRSRTWSRPLLDSLGIPAALMPEVAAPGTIVGPLADAIARETGLEHTPPVIAGACHDTAAAVAAVPALEDQKGAAATWAYLSSGTWSLMGIELRQPLISPAVLEENFTNEGGAGGTIRFLRNIMGLWLVQESRREWERGGRKIDYEALADLAANAPSLRSLVVPDDPLFFPPGDMPGRIREFCRRTGQPQPEDEGAVIRCALESLALAYRDNAGRIERLTGKRIERLHIVGGGSKNRLLDQLTADALGVEVVAGPAEATALGNALMQAVAAGALPSVAALRGAVRASVGTETFTPRAPGDWDRAAERFRTLSGQPAAG